MIYSRKLELLDRAAARADLGAALGHFERSRDARHASTEGVRVLLKKAAAG